MRALPVRPDGSYPADLIRVVTDALRTPAGKQTLRDVQAKALYDLSRYRQGFFPMRVGSGKTLVTFLAARVVGAQRPLLVLPAALIEKTDREWRHAAADWQVSQQLRMTSYQQLGRVSGADKLEVLKPDLLILDEGHRAKNPRAPVTRRLERYLKANPKTMVIVLSGTIMKKSIMDFSHLLEWTNKQQSPLPMYKDSLVEWAEALDEGVNVFQRRDPGVLLELFPSEATPPDAGGDANRQARVVFQKRLKATPGIVVSDTTEDFAGSLVVSALEYPVDSATEANFKTLRETMCRPDGWALAEAMHVWAVARQLALGLHYEWDPAPPELWMDARKSWAKFVREYIGTPEAVSRGFDSELQVANGVERGDIVDEFAVLEEWRKVRPTFGVNPKDVWHDDSALRACLAWIKAHPRGIVWCEHSFFARSLSRVAGIPYYGAQGKNGSGAFIEDHESGPVIASIAANCTGRNLQYKWCDNLVTAPPSDSERWEQIIARTHRPGQTEDTVTVDVLIACREHLESVPRALASSDIKTDLLGFAQKLRIADLVWPDMTKPRQGFRWA